MSETKKLYRSDKDKIITGVCGGLGAYFNIDPIVFRIIFVLLALGHGAGVLIYIVATIVMPTSTKEEGSGGPVTPLKEVKVGEPAAGANSEHCDHWHVWPDWGGGKSFGRGANVFGLLLVAVGLIAFINIVFPNYFDWFKWDYVWPLVIVLIGVVILLKHKN